METVDTVFLNSGQCPGLEIWRIEVRKMFRSTCVHPDF